MNNFNEVMTTFFNQLGIDPIEFNYNEKTKKYITTESFTNEDDDPEAYYMVVKMNENIGTVVIGTSDGIKFSETEMLGQIRNDNGVWVTL